jgi:hypothetical protein
MFNNVLVLFLMTDKKINTIDISNVAFVFYKCVLEVVIHLIKEILVKNINNGFN